MIKTLQEKVNIMDSKIRFIRMKLDGKIKFEGLKKLEIVKLLESHNFDKIHNDYFSSPTSPSEEESEPESENTELNNNIKGYNYLMKMSCWTFSSEEVII